MRAEPNPPSNRLEVVYHDVGLGLRSRIALWFMRAWMKPMLARMVKKDLAGIVRIQQRVYGMRCRDTAGLPLEYRKLGVDGHLLGELRPETPALLWLHGGAFVLPAAPTMHLPFLARLARELNAAAFMPDYRLAPLHRFPAGLDDCVLAYRALLDAGQPASKIVLGGDSAGGNLMFGVMQRIRSAGLPMPACAISISPVADMTELGAPPPEHRGLDDVLLPSGSMKRMDELYIGDWDKAHPELSPVHMDCTGLPPLMFMASENEFLVDGTILLANRTHAAGVHTICHVWKHVPHAFPLFEGWFPEVSTSRADLVDFVRRHLP